MGGEETREAGQEKVIEIQTRAVVLKVRKRKEGKERGLSWWSSVKNLLSKLRAKELMVWNCGVGEES